MKLSCYTIDDLRLGYDPQGEKGWRMSHFLDWRDALEHYSSLPESAVKSLGVSDGEKALELIRHLSVKTDAVSQEEVLVMDFLGHPLWMESDELVSIVKRLVSELDVLYCLTGDKLVLAPTERPSTQWLSGTYLWPDTSGVPESAIRWVYVLGTGWLPPAELKRRYPDPEKSGDYPVVLKYRADGVASDGTFRPLELSYWEYRTLANRTKARYDHNKSRRSDPK